MAVYNVKNEFENIWFMGISWNILYILEKGIRNPPKFDSNLRNVTKTLHVPKCDICSKCEIKYRQKLTFIH